MRTILHQIPYYIPPVIIANIINIGIFAFMMGFIEIFPNLLALVFGTSKNMSLILNSTVETVVENSGDTGVPVDPSDTSIATTDQDEDPTGAGGDTFDVTLAYAVFVSSIVVAGVGQVTLASDWLIISTLTSDWSGADAPGAEWMEQEHRLLPCDAHHYSTLHSTHPYVCPLEGEF